LKSPRLAPSVLVSAALLLLTSCKLGRVNYDKFEQRTIEENLAAIDSALVIYQAQFAAGNIDSACAQAKAFLLTQEGVDAAVVAPDSTVWAFFSSGLLAGTGDIGRDTTGDSAGAAPRRAPEARAANGGEVWPPAHYAVPYDVELPGTKRSADALSRILLRKLGSQEDEMFTGSQVDLGLTEGLINPGTGLLFWAGHGTTVPRGTSSAFDGGLILGKGYAQKAMAEAAVRQLAGDLNPGPGQERQAAVMHFVGDPYFSVVVLPGFIRAHGYFDNAESLSFNSCKTIVYLSCCFSGYGGANATLLDAFRAAGADLVCGWSSAVNDAFACDVDTILLRALADTCLAGEAFRVPATLTDPNVYDGLHATFVYRGDTLLLMQAVVDAKKSGTLYRSCPGWTVETYASQATKLCGFVRQDGSADDAAMVTFLFPSTSPGGFDLFTSGAYITWADIASGRTYSAQAGYVGTGGTLTIDKCTDSLVVGHFTAHFGWWDIGKSPYVDPPSDTFSLTDGVLKYTGKITSYGAEAALPGSVSAQLPAGF
jgi:hypothetical protein